MLFMCQAPCQALCIFISLNPLNQEAGSIYYLHFADEETKAQRGEVTCPRSQSQQMPELVAKDHHTAQDDPVLVASGHGVKVSWGSVQ